MSHGHPGFGDEHAHDHAVTPPDGCREIGPGVCMRPSYTWRPDKGETEKDGRIVGYVVAHTRGEGVRCESAVMIEAGYGPPVWQQTGSWEAGDLTLTPSLQCKTHPEFHAYVTDGRWTGV